MLYISKHKRSTRMELITDLNDPRIHPDKVTRTRAGRTQEFRHKGKRSFDGDFYIESQEKHLYLEPKDDGWEWVNGCGPCKGEPRGWGTYIECDKHDVCRQCARTRQEITGTPWGGSTGWICTSCELRLRKIEIAERQEKGFEHEYTQEVVCPYCGYEHSDSWEMSDDETDRECPDCEKIFDYERIVTCEYSSSKKED